MEISKTCIFRWSLPISDITKIKALKNECMHKVGIALVSKYDKDLQMLEKSLLEEDSKIKKLK